MKAKTIKQVLAKKHKEWVDTIDDKELRIQVRKHTLITGGCIASMLLNEKVNDYDVYFTNRATLIDVVKYYLRKFCELNGNYHLNGYDANKVEETTDKDKLQKYINLLVEPDRVKIRINSRDLRPATETGYEKPEDDVAADEPTDDLSQFEHLETTQRRQVKSLLTAQCFCLRMLLLWLTRFNWLFGSTAPLKRFTLTTTLSTASAIGNRTTATSFCPHRHSRHS